jgi:heme exporter protein A
MLDATGLAAERGGKLLFRDIDLHLQQGELLHVSGTNGSGKTTLLRLISGLTLPAAGEIFWQGKPVTNDQDNFHESLLYIGHSNGIHADLNAVENLQLATTSNTSSSDIKRALQTVGLSTHDTKPVRQLSQGQQRRVALCRLLLEQRPLWILDEPLASLDVEAIEWFSNCLEQHLGNGGMAIFTTHQEASFISQVSCRVVLNQ